MSNDRFLIDVFAGDKPVSWQRLADAGEPWVGGIAKSNEGISFVSPWFGTQWRAMRTVCPTRNGQTWFRGAYAYWRSGQDAVKQAHVMLGQVDQAGGLDDGSFLMIDVEGANNSTSISANELVHEVSTFAAELKKETSRRVVLYGNIYLAEHGMVSTCGCDALIVARYTPTLPSVIYERIGWHWSNTPGAPMPTLLGWQYAGSGGRGEFLGDTSVTKYPSVTPVGICDTTALIGAGGGDGGLDLLRRVCAKIA